MEKFDNTNIDYQILLNTATDVGHFLLESGAEIYRVEESIQRMLYAYQVKHVDAFAIPSCIIVTITTEDDQCFTRLRRIYSRGTNFDVVDQLNTLCRYICQQTPAMDVIQKELKEIRQRPIYSTSMTIFCYALVAFSFTLFFGGMLSDAISAAVLGGCVKVLIDQLDRFHTNTFFKHIICSAFVTICSLLLVMNHFGAFSDKIIIGTLMNLVPGVAITNSMRDIIAGDLIAGLLKSFEALIIAAALAIGTGIALTVAGGII